MGIKWSYLKPMNRVPLPGSLDPDQKLQILKEVYTETENSIRHYDDLRQRNLNFALIIFAGLFGLGVKVGNNMNPLYITIPWTLLMLVFFLLERKFHKYSHGSQGAKYRLVHKMIRIQSKRKLIFRKYDYQYAKKAEWMGLQAIIYYSLIIGAAMSYFYLPLVSSGGK